MVEPPYPGIWDLMEKGMVIPFLGAGASFVGRPPDGEWNPDAPAFLPKGYELARFLAKFSRFPSKDAHDLDNLAKVSSYLVDALNRPSFRSQLHEKLCGPYNHGAIHRFLARVPAPQLIVVTNYDTLLEQAFRDANRPFDLVVHPTDRKDLENAVLWWKDGVPQKPVAPKNLDINLKETTVIYKMHGTIDHETEKGDHFVITEDDYVVFLNRMLNHAAVPSQFIEHFRERHFLFLGYSLNDWNLRVILKNVRSDAAVRRGKVDQSDKKLNSWAIQTNPSELETSLWRKREIDIFDMAIDDFAAELADAAKIKI